MTPARSALVAVLAVVLIATLPVAGAEEQYPRGLMSVEPTTPSGRTCTIDVRPISFGTYDPLAPGDLDALGQVIYVCGNLDNRASDNKQIRIELETGGSNTYSPRLMTLGTGADFLEYNIYLDPTHRSVWGNGYNSDVYVDSHPPNRQPVTVPAFGRIPANQDVPAGQYFDAMIVRIVF